MRNLKKFLALVLAMMMTLGLMVTANAASAFTDVDSITDEFTESVAVLEGLGVFEGYEDGSFKPKNSITRAEVATIVYRLATGDVEGKQAHLYKDYQNFKDVASTDWYAGYVNYCANAEWIAGYGDGTFGPNKSVTGYQAAAMILRAVGYGKNNEFKGTGWQVQVANFTRSLGLLVNVDNTTYANTLNSPAPRELVAEILFQAGLIDTVSWTQLQGYQSEGKNDLAWQNFKLAVSGYTTIDKWGRPGYYWFKGTNTKANRVATIGYEPTLEFTDVKKECDVAHELDIDTNDTFDLYVNRNTTITTKYLIEATDTVTNVGGQGRITEFYDELSHPYVDEMLAGSTEATTWNQSVVMVDTYLATVTNVTERVVDPAGHEIVPAYLYVDVYDGNVVGGSSTSGANQNTTKHRVSKTGSNWEYVKGDKVLLQGYTQYNDGTSTDHGAANGTSAAVINLNNKAAFETNRLRPAGTNYANDASTATATNYTNINVVGKAEMKQGKQTVTYWNTGKHTVDGTDYMDANTLFLDVAGTTTNTTYAWYFDEYGNIIGIDNIPDTVNFGVITSLYSAFNQGEDATTGTAKAVANVTYADGTTGTVTIDKFLVGVAASGTGHPTANTIAMTANSNANNAPSSPWSAGSLELVPVYDYSSTNVMGVSSRTVTAITSAPNAGNLHVAPVASINASEDKNDTTHFGIIRGNMFKFVSSTDGTVTAIEVAGTNGNTGIYAGHRNALTTMAGNRLYKDYSYIDLTSAAGTNADVRLDSDTYIMVRNGNSVSCYTIDTLPGDVVLSYDTATSTASEVDWADTDGDNRAEYVYVTGTVQGSVTYGLFYYNGGAAQWNGTEKNGTLFGYLNGEPTTLTFIGENSFNAVKNSQAYAPHLFAVQMTNGVVTALMQSGGSAQFVGVSGSAFTGGLQTLTHPTSGATFVPGILGDNPYNSTSTEAIYLADVAPNNTTASVSYDPSTRTIIVWTDDGSGVGGVASDGIMQSGEVDDTYYLNGNSIVRGLGMGVTQEDAILDYLNKSVSNNVTIVYEQSGVKSIVEIYVATDPNVTPGDPGKIIGDLGITSLSFSSGNYNIGVFCDAALTQSTNYATIEVSMAKWNGTEYVDMFVEYELTTAYNLDGTNAGNVVMPYSAASAEGTYKVCVEYLNAAGDVVASSGDVIVYCS